MKGTKGEGQGCGEGNWTWMDHNRSSIFWNGFGDAEFHEHLPFLITQSLDLPFPSACFPLP